MSSFSGEPNHRSDPPPIQVWLERIKTQLPFTVPTGALIAVLLVAAFVFFQMLRILFTSANKPKGGRSAPPHYSGVLDGEGRYHGSGALRLMNGNRYTGEFVHGVFEGHGVYSFKATGTQYDGQWKGGAKEGRGRETYSDGSVYIGEYKGGEREGKGRMEYGGERGVFEGGWKAGRKHGEGRVRERVDGKWKWRKGEWMDGRPQKTQSAGEGDAEDEQEGEEEAETAGGGGEEPAGAAGIRQRNNSQPQQAAGN